MKAMVLHRCAPVEHHPLVLEEHPDPEPSRREIRVKVLACGVCRTDLHVVEGELPPLGHPVIPGHQIVGRVEKRGPEAHRFREGDRVGIAWLRHTCGVCRYCQQGFENLCEKALFTGYHAPGGYATHAVVHEDFAYPIADNLSDAEATPLLCAGIIGYRSLKRALCGPSNRQPAEGPRTLALYGFGSSAHIVIQIARHWGYEVYAISRTPRHQKLARDLGAVWAGTSAKDLPVKVQHAIVFAPAGPLVPEALEHLDKGGTLALAGIYMTQIPAMDYEKHLFYEKNVHSVTANTRQDALELLETAAAVPVRAVVRTYPLTAANEALQDLKANRLEGTGVLLP
ncbi:zinc-dependent alcohol dehydrogenase family protein [Desulfosoma caldarium]|uniref:alcohol dehydrogenase n=1 Tax=Desulfosoma caldarium TaxID=610254 RepID=A0A3N1VF21_9BACT|nr:zinc-dependent alcohol dehydrogenase family protein [Desulfosoma caldarium]ROR01483.1 propanol-preferring alcohol dehydrogenase [Desulfosoma caldarium]